MKTVERKRVTSIPAIEKRKGLVVLDRIRLGFKAQKGDTEYPVELPFFLLPDIVATHYGGHVSRERAEELGVTRKDVLRFVENNAHRLAEELPIMLPINDVATVFPYSYVWFGKGRGVKCEGNGEKAQRKQDDGTWIEVDCPCEKLEAPEDKKAECAHCGVLSFMIPRAHPGAVFQMTTRGFNSIKDILSGIDSMCQLISKKPANEGGVFAQIPFLLKRAPKTTHHNDKPQLHFTVQLIPAVPLADVIRFRQDQNLIIERAATLQIPYQDPTNPEDDAPDEVIEDGEIIDEDPSASSGPGAETDNKTETAPQGPAPSDSSQKGESGKGHGSTSPPPDTEQDKIIDQQKDAISELRDATGLQKATDMKKVLSVLTKRKIKTLDDLTKTEASGVVDFLLIAKNGNEGALKIINEAKAAGTTRGAGQGGK